MPSRTVQYNGAPSKLVQAYRHYATVPKDPALQRAFRLKVRQRCIHDEKFREQVLEACAADPLFWLNTFCYLVEPREQELRLFNTWPHQDEVIAEMVDGWGKRDFVGKKSREQGASWIMAALFAWAFTFLRNQELRFGSKDDETMDEFGNMDSFGAKIDFLLERMPEWMRPQYKRNVTKHTWRVIDKAGKTKNVIKGYSATAGIARGGRCTVFFLDEAAFFPPGSDYEADVNLQRVTNCSIWWSTFNGLNNAFADKVFGENNATLMVLDFLDNPVHGKGKYTTTSGKLEVLDGEPVEGYPYVLDGLVRSFWLDQQWLRSGKNMIFLAQELYMDPMGSKGRPFPAVVIERAKTQCRAPLERGMLLFDYADPGNVKDHQWVRSDAYHFELWRPVDGYGRMYVQKPVIGADIALGNSGDLSSNSVLSLWDAATWEQVGELAANTISPTEMARLAVAVCYWLSPSGHTFFVWEKNGGAGTTFTDEMLLLGYSNVYYMNTGGDEQRHTVAKTDKPGYHTSKTSLSLQPLLSAMERNDATFRSHALVAECSEYEIDDRGRWVHPRALNSRDPSARGEGHGDRAIAAAMALRGMRERKPAASLAKKKTSPRSMLGRIGALKESERIKRRALSRW